MGEEKKIFIDKKTSISIGIVLILINLLIVGAFKAGTMAQRVTTNEGDIITLNVMAKELPTRTEFDRFLKELDSLKEEFKEMLIKK